MARKMKKFSAGGAQGRYDRRMADIKKDFAKDSAGKSGRALEVLEAKRAQRIADAEDDRAKRMGTDRTATRKAEYEAEQRLSRTRRFGADKPAATPAATTVKAPAATTTPAAAAAAETTKAKPKTTREEFNAAFSAARAKAVKEGRDPNKEIFTFRGQKKVALMATAPKPDKRTNNSAGTAGSSTNNSAGTASSSTNNSAAASATAAAAKAKQDAAAKAKQDAAAKVTGPSTKRGLNPNSIAGMIASGKLLDTPDSFRKSQEAKYGKAKGGKVKKETTMKYRSGGSTPPKPPQPTAADRARSKKHLDELKKLKPTPEQAAAIGRANRSSGYAKGGKVKKMAVGGMSTMPPATTNTAPPAASNTAPPAANTAARPTTTSVAPPAANTAARPTVGPGMSATTQGTDAERRAHNAQAILQAKYSSATPNRDKSATITSAGVRTPASFDRNQALRDFNTVGRNFIGQGVPQKAVIQAQGELRKLQMDNRSTPAQHQAAIQSILARMNSLVPKKAAKGGSMKAANKSGRALVKKSADTEGRAMKKFASGGLVGGHKAANGIAKKGLTKGTQVKMNKGGACYAKGGSVRGIDGIATKGKTRCKGARK